MGKILGFVGVCLGLMALSTVLTAGQAPKDDGKGHPPARKVPGITAEDPHPQACVSCHIDMPQMQKDVRIGTLMKKWEKEVTPRVLAFARNCAPEGVALKGVHPGVERGLDDIPVSCFKCHDKMAKKAPPLRPMLHLIHLAGDPNEYLSLFQGECTYCHKFDSSMGKWSVPSGPEQ